MNPRAYDISMLIGIGTCTAGDFMLQGAGAALVMFGCLLMATTAYSAFLSR